VGDTGSGAKNLVPLVSNKPKPVDSATRMFECGRYRTRTCDPLLVRNKRGLGYIGFAGPGPVFMRFWVPVVDGCFVLLRSGWCPRGAPSPPYSVSTTVKENETGATP
jgi:hypothetical protein